jgi:hypothetical protein
LVFKKTQKETTFWNRDLFLSSDEGRETRVQIGLLERTNIDYWSTCILDHSCYCTFFPLSPIDKVRSQMFGYL